MKGRSKSPARKRHVARVRVERKKGKLVVTYSFDGKQIAKSALLKKRGYDAARVEKLRAAAIARYRKAYRSQKSKSLKRKASKSPKRKSKKSKSPKRKSSSKSRKSKSPKRRKKTTKKRKSSKSPSRRLRGYRLFLKAYSHCYKTRAVKASALSKRWSNLPKKYKDMFKAAKGYDDACRIMSRYVQIKRYRKKKAAGKGKKRGASKSPRRPRKSTKKSGKKGKKRSSSKSRK